MSDVKTKAEINADRSDMLHIRAYDMFPLKHEPDKHVENPFPMFSYERAATLFWSGFIDELVERGLSDKEVEELLRSKDMRWMFDAKEDDVRNFAKSMVNDNLIESAKRLAKES